MTDKQQLEYLKKEYNQLQEEVDNLKKNEELLLLIMIFPELKLMNLHIMYISHFPMNQINSLTVFENTYMEMK